MQNLTLTQFKVWALIARGLSNKAIAQKLCYALKTIEKNITALYKALGISVEGGCEKRVLALRAWGD